MTVIFLDIDGILIRDATVIRGKKAKLIELFGPKNYYSALEWSIATAYFFDPSAVNCLDKLIEKLEQKGDVGIVLSSSWRENGTLKEIQTQMFSMWPFSQKIIDKTVHNKILRSRAAQIDHWLNTHSHLNIVDYLILDDWDDGLSASFGNQFLHVKNGALSHADINSFLHKML